MSWLNGLNLKWKLAAKGSAKYQKPALFTCRKDLVAKLCKIFSIKDEEDAEWADVDWDEPKVSSLFCFLYMLLLTFSSQKVIDKHEKFTDLNKGLAVNPPPGFHLDTHGRLQQEAGSRPAPLPTETDNETSVSSPPASQHTCCLLYTSPSPRDGLLSRMPSSA